MTSVLSAPNTPPLPLVPPISFWTSPGEAASALSNKSLLSVSLPLVSNSTPIEASCWYVPPSGYFPSSADRRESLKPRRTGSRPMLVFPAIAAAVWSLKNVWTSL